MTESGKLDSVKNKIAQIGNNVVLTSPNSNTIVVRREGFVNNVNSIEKEFKKIKGVLHVKVINRHLNRKQVDLKEAFRTNRCRIVFDVDGTLTQLGPGTIHPVIEDVFKKINGKGIRIYIATGRSMYDLNTILKNYPTIEKHSICENGGLILGFPPDNYFEFGDKTEPNKVLEYLQTKYGVKEDMIQGDRFTEVIFLKKDVSLKKIEEARKKKGAKISINESERAFHISKDGIHKGTAILELAKRMHWENTMIIAVGDTDMDIKMFEKASYSFAMGNATPGAKAAASQVLKGKYEKGIQEIYELIKKV